MWIIVRKLHRVFTCFCDHRWMRILGLWPHLGAAAARYTNPHFISGCRTLESSWVYSLSTQVCAAVSCPDWAVSSPRGDYFCFLLSWRPNSFWNPNSFLSLPLQSDRFDTVISPEKSGTRVPGSGFGMFMLWCWGIMLWIDKSVTHGYRDTCMHCCSVDSWIPTQVELP